jgi:RNA polymerase sigma factor (sigma-70 family)
LRCPPRLLWCDRQHSAEEITGSRIEELYREHWPLVCGFLLRRVRDPHLAEDLAQETFAKATRALLGWRGESPAGWLLSIARNVLIDHVRRTRYELALPDPDELGALREVAADGLIYAYVDPGMRIGDVRKLIDDRRVRTARIAEVTYDVGF